MFCDSCIEWYATVAASPVLVWMAARFIFNTTSRYVNWNNSSLGHSRPFLLRSAHLWHLPSLDQEGFMLPSLITTANVIALSLRIQNVGEVANRSGIVATVNLALLLAGAQLDIVATMQEDSLRSQLIVHRYLSVATVLTTTLHVLAVVVDGRVTRVVPVVWGFVAALFLLAAASVSVNWMRRHFFEAFFQVHFWSTAVVATALLQHIAEQRRTARLYILIGICAWFSLFSFRFVVRCFRNTRVGEDAWIPKVSIRKVYRTATDDQVVLSDAYHVHLWVHRSFTVRPGQYLYLAVPCLGVSSLWPSHPFWIVWWNPDSNQDVMHLQMLVRPRQGFTRRLLSYRDKRYSALIDGPYGRSRDLTRFETVLMFAADIGVAAHVPYLRWLMDQYQASATGPRRVVVVWEIKDGSHANWTRVWFDELLRQDASFGLEIRIFCPGGKNLGIERTDRTAKLPRMFSRSVNLERILGEEVRRPGRGRTMLSVCMGRESQQTCRRLVRMMNDSSVELMEHDFQVPDH